MDLHAECVFVWVRVQWVCWPVCLTLQAIFSEAEVELKKLWAFVMRVEHQLNDYLKKNETPPLPLQQAIAVCKVKVCGAVGHLPINNIELS